MRRGSESLLGDLLSGSSRKLLVGFCWMIALIVLISVLIWLVVRVRTRYRGDEDLTAADQSMLLQLGDLRRQGDLSEAEYRSIKGRLVDRIDKSMSAHDKEESATITPAVDSVKTDTAVSEPHR